MTMKQMLLGATAMIAVGLVALPAMARDGMAGRMGGKMPGFAQLDSNSDGKITAEEMTAAHVARIAALDADKDGFVTAEEIVAARLSMVPEGAMRPDAKSRMTEKITAMLARKDADKDGKVSLAEMGGPQKPAQVEKMIARLDTDRDGAINKSEFDAMLARMAEHRKDVGPGKGRHDKGQGYDNGGHGQRGHDHGPRRGMTPVPRNLAPPPAVGVQPFPAPMQ